MNLFTFEIIKVQEFTRQLSVLHPVISAMGFFNVGTHLIQKVCNIYGLFISIFVYFLSFKTNLQLINATLTYVFIIMNFYDSERGN